MQPCMNVKAGVQSITMRYESHVGPHCTDGCMCGSESTAPHCKFSCEAVPGRLAPFPALPRRTSTFKDSGSLCVLEPREQTLLSDTRRCGAMV